MTAFCDPYKHRLLVWIYTLHDIHPNFSTNEAALKSTGLIHSVPGHIDGDQGL